MNSQIDLLVDSWFPQEEVTELGEQAVGGAIKPECSEVGHPEENGVVRKGSG